MKSWPCLRTLWVVLQVLGDFEDFGCNENGNTMGIWMGNRESILTTLRQPNSLLLKIAIYSWFTHWKWWFSTAMLVYQRVYVAISLNMSEVLMLTKKCKKKITKWQAITLWFFIIIDHDYLNCHENLKRWITWNFGSVIQGGIGHL